VRTSHLGDGPALTVAGGRGSEAEGLALPGMAQQKHGHAKPTPFRASLGTDFVLNSVKPP